MNLVPFFSGPGDQNTNTSESTKLSKDAIRKKIAHKKRQDKLNQEKDELEFEGDSARFSRKYETYKNTKARSGLEEDFYPPKLMGSTEGSVNDEDFETSEDYIKAKGIGFKDWEKILKNDDIDNTSHIELAEALRYGAPDELRPQIWAFLTKLENLKKQHSPTLYTKLKNLPGNSDEQIQRDIGRTFNDQPFFTRENKKGQQILFNILRAYANYDTEIGYTQGMNVIVGTLLVILDPNNYKNSKLEYFKNYEETFEENAFWLFIHICFGKNYRVIYKTDFPKLLGMIKYLENRIKAKAPEVEEHILNNDLETFLCFHQLFISMLLANTPLPISQRILDLFFIEEEKLLFKVLIRAITVCKKEILELRDEKLRNFFDQQMMQLCYEKYKNRLYLLFPSAESSD